MPALLFTPEDRLWLTLGKGTYYFAWAWRLAPVAWPKSWDMLNPRLRALAVVRRDSSCFPCKSTGRPATSRTPSHSEAQFPLL